MTCQKMVVVTQHFQQLLRVSPCHSKKMDYSLSPDTRTHVEHLLLLDDVWKEVEADVEQEQEADVEQEQLANSHCPEQGRGELAEVVSQLE